MLPLKWRQTFWCVLVRQICVCRVTICWWSQFMSETSLLLLSGIVWASRVDDVRWAFLRHHVLMKSDVCVWNFIGSPLIKSDVCFWNFIIVGCDPSNVCFWGGSLLMKSDVCFWNFIIGTGITACLSQLFGTWVHWWRRVLVLWRCRKNRKPRLDFSSRCLTSSEAGLWTHQYCWVRQVNWLVWDLLAFGLLR